MMFLLNLTHEISPTLYPEQFANYPYNAKNDYGKKIRYAIPVFFQYQMFTDLKLGYLVGVGIERY